MVIHELAIIMFILQLLTKRQLQTVLSFACAPEPAQRQGSLSILPLLPLAPADQHLVGGGLEGEAEAEQALEGGGGVAPAVEPEGELVQVGLEVLPAQPVVDA